jgi:hypothetical protein
MPEEQFTVAMMKGREEGASQQEEAQLRMQYDPGGWSSSETGFSENQEIF